MCLRFLFLQVACIWVIKSTYTEVTSERVIVWGVDLVVANRCQSVLRVLELTKP